MDWPLIRQALSISLMKKEPLLLKGAYANVCAEEGVLPVYSDLKKIVIETGTGILTEIEGDIAYKPDHPGHGIFYISAGEFTPLSEIELFFLPYLFNENFRSVSIFRELRIPIYPIPLLF
jgi:hypothetical protein